ncbi:MAG: DMT family transporter [Alphaproteobacteria bacterium]|jgi:drug/metabolite transporter (DMT)-like permease|nr:DMT family transporter [Alphaproteobacteria bacterium]
MGNWRNLTAGMARLPLLPTAMLFACGITWGLSFSFNKIAITSGIPVIAYVFWQSLGAGLILLILSFATANRMNLSWPHLKLYGASALFQFVLPFLALNYVADRLPAGVVSLGQALVPALTFGFAMAFRIDRYSMLRFAGLCIGLAGVLLVVLPKASLPDPGMVGWVLIALIAPLCYGFANTLVAIMRPPQSNSIPLAAGLLLGASTILLLLMAATDSWWFFDAGLNDGALALIGVTVVNVIFWYLLFEIIHLAGPVFFASYNYISPLAGIGWAVLILHERHSVWIWAALALMFAGLFLVNRRARAAPQQRA